MSGLGFFASRVTPDFAAFIILHELSHFVGRANGQEIHDFGRGWFNEPFIAPLKAVQRLANADSYATFAHECLADKSDKPPFVESRPRRPWRRALGACIADPFSARNCRCLGPQAQAGCNALTGEHRMTRPQPSWRSLLFVPVLSERFLAKAHERGADAIILDLEDSILPTRKADARAALPAAVPRVAQKGADVVVRINRPLDLAVADIAASVMPGVAALMLPKVMGPEHVRLLAELVSDREAALGMPIGHTRFLVLIESPAALPHLYAIAAEPRMAGMSVGGEDMATELGAIPSADSMYVFAMQGLAAARAAGILPMGSMGQLANINDLDSYRAGLKRGKALGFTTASCIHPAHVPIINEEYGASDVELDRARRLIAAFDAAAAEGAGAVAFEGSMIDLPVVIRARRLLERAASWSR